MIIQMYVILDKDKPSIVSNLAAVKPMTDQLTNCSSGMVM
jgi:hypothetical protein